VASGAVSHTLNFGYDQWGNMSCTGGAGNCTQINFDTTTNRINSPGYSFDAAGNMLRDPNTVPATNYSWDAEGRLTTISENGAAYATNTYNADGQVVEVTYPGFNAKVEGIFDPGGRELGNYDGVHNVWYDQDIWAAGRIVAQLNPADTYFLHANHLHSDVQVTDHTGAVKLDLLYYPWGQTWTYSGSMVDAHFAGFQRAAGTFYTTPTRRYSNVEGRWMSPDPMGGHYEDPQTLDRYAYVRNNPLKLTDPTGLDIWLQGCGKDSSTCKDNYVGTTDKNGNFQKEHLTGDQTKDATIGPHGISVSQDGKTYAGVWDTNKGENGTVTVAGSGALNGYVADVKGNCGGSCVASGDIRSSAANAGNITQALFKVLDTNSSGYAKNAGTDAWNFFHPGATNFRGHADSDQQGIPSTHIPIDPKASLPNNEWHVDRTYPYDGVGDWLEHAGCASHTICNPQK
jgi:RHS repeat-associated protein